MKKKGRICGTIGFILSLALAGGTVVFGTMFYNNTVGKAEKPFGASTGNVIEGFTKGVGFEETKLLVDESMGVLDGSKTDGKYTSYSLSFSNVSSWTTKADKTETVVNDRLEGVVYTDANYTYVKYTANVVAERKTEIKAFEYVLDKKTSEIYYRTNNKDSAKTETPEDVLFADKAKWAKTTGTAEAFDVALEQLKSASKMFAKGKEQNKVKLNPMGEYFFEGKFAGDEDMTTECRFTVGMCPTIRVTGTLNKAKDSAGYGVGSLVLNYSNLNNTKVELPESLKEAMKK